MGTASGNVVCSWCFLGLMKSSYECFYVQKGVGGEKQGDLLVEKKEDGQEFVQGCFGAGNEKGNKGMFQSFFLFYVLY